MKFSLIIAMPMQTFTKYFIPVITAGMGVLIGGLVDWKKEDVLEDKKFEYRIIEGALAEETQEKAAENLKFMIDIGLISSLDTTVINNKINNNQLPLRDFGAGRCEGLVVGNLMGLIAKFFKQKNRVPRNFNELNDFQPIGLHIQILGKENVIYKAADPRNFELLFAGKDLILYSDDDKTYGFKDLKL